MILFKSLYSEALIGFPYNENCIFSIVTEERGDNNRYHSLEWNHNYFFDLLLNQAPRAVNLLFITPDFWIVPDTDWSERNQLEFWDQLRTHRNAFVTKEYAKNANDTINLFVDRCIRNRITSQRANMLDLARILYAQEILMSIINTRYVNYPLEIIAKQIDSCKTKHEMISKVIGRQNIVDKVIEKGDILKHVSGFTKNQVSRLRKEADNYDR